MNKIIITFPEYIRTIRLSESRRISYYDKDKALPKAKMYLDRTKYDYQKYGTKSYLVDLLTGERVIKNPRAAGTPNDMVINGQKIYNGEMNPNTRNKVMSSIKKSFFEEINKCDIITEFPLKMTLEIHDTIKVATGNLWDVDNRAFPYVKAFQDCLTGAKIKGVPNCKQIIPDDNNLFVCSSPAPKFIPISDEKDRKLVFIIEKETDPRILKNVEYCKILDEELTKYYG